MATQREDSGVLFKNDFKKADNQPDYRGECNIGGVIYEQSAWIKEGQKGKFFSFAYKRKDDNKFTGASNKTALLPPVSKKPISKDYESTDLPF